ncbi:MAG: flagellar hook-associated protein FlgL [Lachnospiraceae bacterium]|nr:flagellar hook-associated protein FlgL [Candidatus Colinaster equi]
MRITTKVIQHNSVNNINNNKVLQDKLNNQMSTEKKIVRPSDDPVVAIRALRLRTNVSQVVQYYSKNIPDAESWMSVTEDALTTVSSVLTDMISQCTKGSSEKLTASDRQTILNELSALRDEVYSTGNADYAGRSVFTGYRTETTLKFTAAENKKYSITEQINNDVIDEITYVNSDYLNSINEVNYNTGTNADIVEQDIAENNIYRIRLSYSNVDNEATTNVPTITLMDGTSINAELISNTATPNPYDEMIATDKANEVALASTPPGTVTDRAIVIPETGEMLISKSIYEKLMALKDDVTTATTDEAEIRITYEKSRWKLDDLKPEHYFACTDMSDADTTNWIKYNQDYLRGLYEKQSIEYDVGLNQSIRVNTTADEVFTHAIGRDVDDLLNSMQGVVDMETTLKRLNQIKEDLDASDPTYDEKLDIINKQIDAANKSLTYLKEKNQKLFETSITKMQNHLNVANYATTNCGTREKKLELIKNRLMSQKTNFETLQSENENIDITDVAIELKGAELTYQAALMSTSKILQTSLMNYI